MKERTDLIKKIAAKRGLLGMAAEHCIDDEYMSNQFLIKCYDDCDSISLRQSLGRDLINEIIIYNVKHNGKLMKD